MCMSTRRHTHAKCNHQQQDDMLMAVKAALNIDMRIPVCKYMIHSCIQWHN